MPSLCRRWTDRGLTVVLMHADVCTSAFVRVDKDVLEKASSGPAARSATVAQERTLNVPPTMLRRAVRSRYLPIELSLTNLR